MEFSGTENTMAIWNLVVDIKPPVVISFVTKIDK